MAERAINPGTLTITGVVPMGDADMDPLSKMSATLGIDVSEVDYAPKCIFFGFIVKGGAAGQTNKFVKVKYRNGSIFIWDISSIAAYEQWIVEGEMEIIYSSGTTAAYIFPICG
jgi:hypothetical protein